LAYGAGIVRVRSIHILGRRRGKGGGKRRGKERNRRSDRALLSKRWMAWRGCHRPARLMNVASIFVGGKKRGEIGKQEALAVVKSRISSAEQIGGGRKKKKESGEGLAIELPVAFSKEHLH